MHRVTENLGAMLVVVEHVKTGTGGRHQHRITGLRLPGRDADSFLHAACDGLSERFRIDHATLQIETDPARACRLAPAEVV